MGNWKVEILDGSHWLSDYLIIKRLSGIRKLKYPICIRKRKKYRETKRIFEIRNIYTWNLASLPKFFKSNRNQIHILFVSDREWLIQNSSTWSSSQWQIRKKKKKVLRNTLHFSFFSPCFLGGAWRVSKTRQIASPCKQENYSQIPEKPQDWSSSVNYKSNREVLKI